MYINRVCKSFCCQDDVGEAGRLSAQYCSRHRSKTKNHIHNRVFDIKKYILINLFSWTYLGNYMFKKSSIIEHVRNIDYAHFGEKIKNDKLGEGDKKFRGHPSDLQNKVAAQNKDEDIERFMSEIKNCYAITSALHNIIDYKHQSWNEKHEAAELLGDDYLIEMLKFRKLQEEYSLSKQSK